jgi:hypothetical protein
MSQEAIRIRLHGDVGTVRVVAKAFDGAGLKVRTDVRHIENRSAGDVAQWIGMYVVGAVIDETAGAPLRTGVRVIVERVVTDLRRRYPNITIRIED